METIPTILVIIGISGDLAQRKLLPAIGKIAQAGELPQKFQVIGITRKSDVQVDQLLNPQMPNRAFLKDHTEIFSMDLTSRSEYQRLLSYLELIEKRWGESVQKLFYLAIPPQISQPVIELLGQSGIAHSPHTKLLLEKPFGVDLASAEELVADITQYFEPEQVYRIDHYLAKETAQNLLVFRQDNSLFKRTWNNQFIESIQITASEKIGIEGRTTFYEQTGALRDLVQSHLLQLAALTLMKPPSTGFESVPARRLAALQQVQISQGKEFSQVVCRGQYQGYAEEVANPESTVETFMSVELVSTAPEWAGVPITLTTGKSLDKKLTEIKIIYKKELGHEANDLSIRLQPDEGVVLGIWAKQPGYAYRVSQHGLRFAFKEHYTEFPEAYEQVLFSAINSDHTLFTTGAEVLETWRILDPLQKAWARMKGDLIQYPVGSSIEAVLALKSKQAKD